MKFSVTLVVTMLVAIASPAVLPRATTGPPIVILFNLFESFSKNDIAGGKAALKALFSGDDYNGFVPACNICGFATRLISLQNLVSHTTGSGQKSMPADQIETSVHHNEDLFKDQIDHDTMAEVTEFISLFAGVGENGTSPQCNLCGFQARFAKLENALEGKPIDTVASAPADNNEQDFIDNVVHVFQAYFGSKNKDEGRKYLGKIYSGEGMDGTSDACNICGFKKGLDTVEAQIKTVKAFVKVPSLG